METEYNEYWNDVSPADITHANYSLIQKNEHLLNDILAKKLKKKVLKAFFNTEVIQIYKSAKRAKAILEERED